jgi:thiosulfate dehydrogenase [quinone] large subunit
MTQPTSPPVPPVRCELTAAFLLLRLFLALRALMSAFEKFELGGSYSFENYQANMTRMATGITGASFLPLWATKAFALPLGYILLVLGGMMLLGVKSRLTLIVMGLLYVALAVGLMAVQQGDGVAWLGVYLGLIVAALTLVRHERFAVWPDRHD